MAGQYDKTYFQKRGRLFSEIKGLVFALLIKLFLRPKTLLDVGCGEGKLVKWAMKLGIKAWGIDISDAAFAKTEPWVRRRCRVGDLLNLPFKNNQFEVVSCLAVMEHIEEGKVNRALGELLRVSQKYVLLQICVTDNPLEKKHYLLDSTHVNVKKSDWWLKKLQELNLKISFGIPKFGVFLLKKK